ncbi:MAG: GTP-binding protein, partial [Rhodanobacteraceae bacterium]
VRLIDGLQAVIIGRPNVGKSSLLNALAQSDRAIVTTTAGTTRDVLREVIDLDGVAVSLVDTAGLRESDNAIEQEGVRRALAELARADAALLVSDDEGSATDFELFTGAADSARRVVVHNKIDLSGATSRMERRNDCTHIWLSARSGQGLELLRTELRRLAGNEEAGQGTFSARSRHIHALEHASRELDAARSILIEHRAVELALEDLRRAQRALDEVTGEFSNEDLLGAIFSTFCIGK